ncbi:hypothetical protein BC831DRAFT_480444, partial [Entophlyctis helioformis]
TALHGSGLLSVAAAVWGGLSREVDGWAARGASAQHERTRGKWLARPVAASLCGG